MIHRISIEDSGESFACAEDVHVLEAMELARCHGIPVGCRNGGCGACKVRIAHGRYTTRKMNRVWQHAVPPKSASFSFGFGAAPPSTSSPDKET